MSEDQQWRPYYLGNPVYATLLVMFFQYGVAVHDLETERIAAGEMTLGDKREMLGDIWRKTSARRSRTTWCSRCWPVRSRRWCSPAT